DYARGGMSSSNWRDPLRYTMYRYNGELFVGTIHVGIVELNDPDHTLDIHSTRCKGSAVAAVSVVSESISQACNIDQDDLEHGSVVSELLHRHPTSLHAQKDTHGSSGDNDVALPRRSSDSMGGVTVSGAESKSPQSM